MTKAKIYIGFYFLLMGLQQSYGQKFKTTGFSVF
jgi:hypothetical protein